MNLEEGDYGGVAGKRGQSRSVRGVGSAQVYEDPQGDELVLPSAVLQQGGHVSSSWRAGGGSRGTNLRVPCVLSPGGTRTCRVQRQCLQKKSTAQNG